MSRYELSVVCQSADRNVARPAGFEPAAFGSGGQRSIQLSYGRVSIRDSVIHESRCVVRKYLANCREVIANSQIANHKSQMMWRARQDSNLRPTDSKSGALSN